MPVVRSASGHHAAEVHFDVEHQVQRPCQLERAPFAASALPIDGRRKRACCNGRVQSLPRLMATTTPAMHSADRDDEVDVDEQAAGADEAEAQDIDRRAVVRFATIPKHPDQQADDDDRERELDHRPGDRAEEHALGLNLVAVMGFEAT